jgi:Transglutaminase-like superfamily
VILHDLDHPDRNPPSCPEWAKETLPPEMQELRGRNGMPPPYCDREYALAMNVEGIDRYQANQFLMYRPDTADYLYSEYTPLDVNYQKGLLPTYEALAAEVTEGCKTETETIMALLLKGASRLKHPCGPPCGPPVGTGRNLDDEALLNSGVGWCNEQARVFIRLCQVCNIPARIVHTFYSDTKSGHCIAECYADGRWCMVDATWFCVFPGPDGKLLSAAQCHDRCEGQKYCGIAYYKRVQELFKLSDGELNFHTSKETEEWRQVSLSQSAETWRDKMNCIAIINYPLPR